MRITITITKKTPAHVTFYIFVNGGRAGEIILRNEEWQYFMELLQPDKITDETTNPCKECGELLSEREQIETQDNRILCEACETKRTLYEEKNI